MREGNGYVVFFVSTSSLWKQTDCGQRLFSPLQAACLPGTKCWCSHVVFYCQSIFVWLLDLAIWGILFSLNNVMKSIFETSCWPGKLQDVLPVQVLTVIYFHMRIPDKQPVIISVSSLTGPSHTDHGVLLLRRPCTVLALLVYTTPNKAGCGWWWLIAGTTIHSILCLYRFLLV